MNIVKLVDEKTLVRKKDKEKEVIYLQTYNVINLNAYTASQKAIQKSFARKNTPKKYQIAISLINY